MGVRHDREFWKRACREVERGAQVGEVARRLGVRPRTLQWWGWRLGRERTKAAETVGFLPVVAQERIGSVSTAAVELETSGVRVRIEVGTDVGYVAALVAAIRRAC